MTREAACPLRESGELVRLICSLTGAHPRSLSECSNSVLEEGTAAAGRLDAELSGKNFHNHRQQLETHRQHACSDFEERRQSNGALGYWRKAAWTADPKPPRPPLRFSSYTAAREQLEPRIGVGTEPDTWKVA